MKKTAIALIIAATLLASQIVFAGPSKTQPTPAERLLVQINNYRTSKKNLAQKKITQSA